MSFSLPSTARTERLYVQRKDGRILRSVYLHSANQSEGVWLSDLSHLTVIRTRKRYGCYMSFASASTAAFPPGPEPVRGPLSIARYVLRMRKGPVGPIGERFRRYGDLYYAPFMGQPLFSLRHPEHLNEVLVSKAAAFEKPRKGSAIRQLARVVGQGLLLSNGEFWRQQRRLIQPSFRRERLDEYVSLMVTHSQKLVESWRGRSEIEASHEMMELTLRIVSAALFDHGITGEADRVRDITRTLRRAIGGIDALLPLWMPTPRRLHAVRALAELDALIYGLIDRPLRGGRDLLSSLRALENQGETGMSRRQLRDEIVTMFLAGHDTTAHALTWTLHLLSRRPEVADKLHAEVDGVLAGRAPNSQDLRNLVYTEQVLSEAMRLYPPAYVLLRVAISDVEIGGYTIPKGADVVMWTYQTHHDERWFPEPERFDPERFSAERRKLLPAGAYLPFGAGTRTCIGKQFAIMEALIALAVISQRYRVLPHPDARVVLDMNVTLAPKHGLPLRIVQRD